ncbi:hypothetical protein FJV80_04250 [Mesorhizobium sp. WSM4310]|uniref:hypothetical protein n=1 Tax=Mesorhizobium sp. WSM4310 TaxID=2589883 RepID=UPI00115C6551|nr:hypothetical protein [Mesorhizobium sp. WSM4310]TRC91139.1 hypothetical protein FJV80_04250 [Mesorhizobium sp. WSM4310]
MAAIDRELRRKRFKLQGRGFEGFRRFSHRHGLGLRFPSTIENPSPGDLSYDALTAHILDWFDARYGRKLNFVYSPSSGIIDIDGDLFLLRVMRIWGQMHFEINPARLRFKYRRLGKDSPPKGNVLQEMDALTQAYADSIPAQQYDSILVQFSKAMLACSEMFTHHQTPLVAEASVDLDAGVRALMDGISFGHARWCFEQAAEKCMKAVIQWETGTYPKQGHKLDNLPKLSSKLIGCNLPPKLLADASCTGKARYGEIATSRDEALAAYVAMLEIVAKVLALIPGQRQMTGLALYAGPFPERAFDPARDGEPDR